MKNPPPRCASALLAILLACVIAPGVPAQETTFEGETSTVLVEVPVTIVHDGAPVRGLEREDFQVYEGRERREIVDFEVVDLATLTAAEAADPQRLPAGARRHFLFLFDFTFSRPGTISRARRAAQELVAEELHPSDLVAVASYSVSGPRMVLGFTSDRTQIDLALESLGFDGVLEGVQLAADPLGLTVASPSASFASSGTLAAIESPGGPESSGLLEGLAEESDRGSAMQEHFEDILARAQQMDRAYQGSQITAMSRGLSDLAELLGETDGQKHVLLLSEGFDTRLFLGGELTEQERVGLLQGRIATYDSNKAYGDPRLVTDIDRMLEEFRRAGATIQAIDIHGLEAAGEARRLDEQALFYLANETGGELFETYNDLGAALGEMLQRNSVTYLLTFRADDLPEDGSYRRLRVEVAGLPRRARINHRAGYYAPVPFTEQAPLAQRMTAAQQLLAGEPSDDFETHALVVPFAGPGDDATVYVPVVVEVGGHGFLGELDAGTAGLELYVYALSPQGGVTDFFTQRLDIDVAKAGGAVRGSGVKLFGHVDLPPGEHTVRVLVRNTATGASSLEIAPLDVPTPEPGDPRLLPPFFPEAPGSWVVVPEPADQQRAGVGFPFMLREQPYLPAVRPEIPADRQIFVNLVAYDLPAARSPQVSVRVLDASGAPTGRATLSIEDRFRLEGERAERFLASLQTDGLAPGAYQLEVTLSDPETGRSSTSTAPFVVGASG